MFISANTNPLATNTARKLNEHYSALATSTQRLSTGLRVNSAADDAAGLAIREFMRADVAALQQGARNINDAISMIQTFDGALGIIDEKLIRMKELAEQAATGTYDSTQRLMIDSEFQAMGAEIDRIANATDFNGIKLIDGNYTNKYFKTYIEVDQESYLRTCLSNAEFIDAVPLDDWNLEGITNPELLLGEYNIEIANDFIIEINDEMALIPTRKSSWLGFHDIEIACKSGEIFINGEKAISRSHDSSQNYYDIGYQNISVENLFFHIFNKNTGNILSWTQAVDNIFDLPDFTINWHPPFKYPFHSYATAEQWLQEPSYTANIGEVTATVDRDSIIFGNDQILSLKIDIDPINNPGVNVIEQKWSIKRTNNQASHLALSKLNIKLTTKNSNELDDISLSDYKIPENLVRIHFGPDATKEEDFYDIKKHDATSKGLGIAYVNIQSQEKAQNALTQINSAIVKKDKIRAYLGAMQNRLENTLTNNTIQSENLQAAESSISDVDVATEMTNFVRNQILTQSAVAMLSQANFLPQMVMQLIR